MNIFSDFLLGLNAALSWEALLFCFIGVTAGTFVGALPGLGALAAISISLPMTFYLDPMIALIMLAGIFYGAQYGSSISSILLNVPGTATAAVTCLDGYPMTKQGRAGVALFVTTITSFVGGMFGIILLMVFAPVLTKFALSLNAPDYFSVMLLGLIAASTLSMGSAAKGLAMVVFGLLLGTIGTDVGTGAHRFTFGMLDLTDGLNLVALAMGLFGVAEIIASYGAKQSELVKQEITMRSMLPTKEDVKACLAPTARGSLLGAVIGAMPGAGGAIASFLAYAVEKRQAKDPSRFGHGAIEGVAAPEAANNASVQAAFIPTLCLGVPGDAVMAILLGAMMIHGITPGPQFVAQNPEMFWGLIASFWIGNLLLLVLNIPLIGMWVKMLSIPRHILYPSMMFFIAVGVYSVNNSAFDVIVTIAFGVIGFVMSRYKYPAAPVLLGFILGPMMEDNFRRTLLISRGDFMVFLERPVSAVLIIISLALLARPLISGVMGLRRQLAKKTA